MLVFKASLRCEGPAEFGMATCTTEVDVEVLITERLEINSVPDTHDTVRYAMPSGWAMRWGRAFCPKCAEGLR